MTGPPTTGSKPKTIALKDQSEEANVGRFVQSSDMAASIGHVDTKDQPSKSLSEEPSASLISPLRQGAQGSHVVTLVERQSRYVILARAADKQSVTVVSALIGQARKLPRKLYRSLTCDPARSLADHPRFSMATINLASG